MTILEMPLAVFLGIAMSSKEQKLLQLSYKDSFRNHINTFHGSVIYSLAEISTGVFLEKHFPREKETTIPVLRRSSVKYSAPCHGELFSIVSLINAEKEALKDVLYSTGRVIINMQADIHDENDQLVFRGRFEWFVNLKPEYLKVSKTVPEIGK